VWGLPSYEQIDLLGQICHVVQGYYWLPLKEGGKVKTTFWGIDV
jgi:hypothetical protein